MEHHDTRGTSPSDALQPRREEDLVFDEDPPAREEAAVTASVQVPVRLELDVWRWLLAQGGDYHTRMNALLREAMDKRETRQPSPPVRQGPLWLLEALPS